jgi:hypothetical protein
VEHALPRISILDVVVEIDNIDDCFGVFTLFFGGNTSAFESSLPFGWETLILELADGGVAKPKDWAA